MKSKSTFVLLLCIAQLFSNSLANAQWKTLPAPTASGYQNTTSLCMLGDRLYLSSTGAGIAYTQTNGVKWSFVNTGLATKDIGSVVSVGTKLIAATADSIYVSTNNAGNWIARSNSLLSGNIASMIATASTVFALINNSVVFSPDGGDSWLTIKTSSGEFHATIINTDGIDVACASDASDVYLYVKGDTAKWQKLAATALSGPITALALTKTQIVAAVQNNGLWYASRSGGDWTQVTSSIPQSEHTHLLGRGSYGLACFDGQPLYYCEDEKQDWKADNTPNLNLPISFSVQGSNLYVTDQDGQIFYRALKEIVVSAPEETSTVADVSINPQPAFDYCSLQFGRFQPPGTCWQVRNLLGQLVKSFTIDDRSETMNFSVQDMSNGVYQLCCLANTAQRRIPFVVKH